MRDPSDPTLPPFHFQNGPGGPPWHAHPEWRERTDRWRRRGNGQPLRRDPEDRLAGGVAAGIAAWRGFNPVTVRIAFLVATLIGGWGLVLYVAGWLLIPARNSDSSIGARARHDSQGIALAVGLAALLAVFLFLAGALHISFVTTWGWPQAVSVAALTLIWRNAPADEQVAIRNVLAPVGRLAGGEGLRRGLFIRLALGVALVGIGLGMLLSTHASAALIGPLGGLLLLAGGFVLLLGPWWLRIVRDLVVERQARARAEERADIAAHMHDSVLQTLALIQRRADDPQAIVQLARVQERELRSWLFEGRAPGDADATSFAAGVRQIQHDVEARHGVPVEVVTVGDCPLDEHLNALLAAAREATVNAAKWSGAAVISLFAEVEADKVSIAVRDRGKGFDPAAVSADRKGLAESVLGRMSRHGGEAAVQSAPGEGTKVTLTMPRTAAPQAQAATAEAAGGSRR